MPEAAVATAPEASPQSSADTFAAMIAPTMGGTVPDPKPEADVPPTPKPEAKAAVPDKPVDGLPEELLKPKAEPADPAKEFDQTIDETPKGQISHANFKAVQEKAKAEVSRLRTELETIRAERDKFKSAEVPENIKTELETLRKQRDDLTAALEKADYQNSPTFRAKFSEKENTIRDSVKSIGKEYGVEDDAMANILSATGKRRDELVDSLEISEGAKRRLDAHLTNLDVLAKDREADLGRAHESLQQERQREQEQSEQRKAREGAELKKIGGEVLKSAAEKLNAFREVEGNPAWNAEVANRKAAFEHAFLGEGLTHHEAAEAFALALDHPVQVKINAALHDRVKDLTAQLEKLTAAAPGGGQAPVHQNGDSANHSPQDTFNRLVGPTM